MQIDVVRSFLKMRSANLIQASSTVTRFMQ